MGEVWYNVGKSTRGKDIMETKQISARIPTNLHRQVKAKAALIDKPIAEIVRELLQEWLEREKEQDETSG